MLFFIIKELKPSLPTERELEIVLVIAIISWHVTGLRKKELSIGLLEIVQC